MEIIIIMVKLNPEKLQEYMELKQSLAIQFANDRDQYSKGKENFIFDAENEIIRKRTKKEN